MDDSIGQLAQVLTIVLAFGTSAGLVGLGFRALYIRTSRREPAPPPALDDERLRRLEQAVDAVAFEVERLGEAQRWEAKLRDGSAAGRLGDGR